MTVKNYHEYRILMQYTYNHIEVCTRYNGCIKSETINASHDGEAENI